MAEATGQERTEEATPRRRQQARRKGTVAKSHDLTSAIVIFALIMALPPLMSNLGRAMMLSFVESTQSLPRTLDFNEVRGQVWHCLQAPLYAFLPLLFLLMGVGLTANFAQVGFVLSGEALTPNLNKLNPLNGFKRLFSTQATFEGIKATIKSFAFGYLAYTVVQARWDEIVSLSWTDTGASIATVGSIMHQIFMKVGVAWLVLAALDYFIQRKQVDKQLKMTKEEVKQEMKDQEQSVEVRTAMARARRRMGKRMMAAVKTADVIITNPTHFSVAIKYEPGKMFAPQVVAKGQDLIALKIREIAKENRVPIVPNPPLARQLYKKCEIGDFVPRDLFQGVAEVLAFVYKTIKKVR